MGGRADAAVPLHAELGPTIVTAEPTPGTVRAIHAIAWVGVAFWVVMVVRAFTGGEESRWSVLGLAIVLGGAHVLVSVLASRRSPRLIWPMWVILVGDLLLSLLVTPKALVLVAATIALLLLARAGATRRWLA